MISNRATFVKVWNIRQEGNRWLASLGSTRKEFWSKAVDEAKANGSKSYFEKGDGKNSGEEFVYVESNWGKFNAFVGKANNKAAQILDVGGALNERGSFAKPVSIKIPEGGLSISNEPYTNKDGQKVWQNAKITVWDFDFPDGVAPSVPQTDDDVDDPDGLPF